MKISSADNLVPTRASCCKRGVDQIRDCILSLIPSVDNLVPTKASCCKRGVDQITDCVLSLISSVDNPVPTKDSSYKLGVDQIRNCLLTVIPCADNLVPTKASSCKQGVDQNRDCLLSSILPHWLTDWLTEPHLHPDFKQRSAWHDFNLAWPQHGMTLAVDWALTLSSLKTATAVERIFPFIPENR